MTNAISGTARFLTTMCDVFQVVESCEKILQTNENEVDTILIKASLVNRLICLGFTITEIGMAISGQKSETMAILKGLEALPRLINMGLSICVESSEVDGSLKSFIRFVSKGVLAPLADITRIASESTCYDEHHYLQMTPEELKDAKRPIYKVVGYGEDAHLEIVGYRPVDIQECMTTLAQAKKTSKAAAAFRLIAASGLPERIVCDISIPVYQRLWRFLNGPPFPQAAATPVAQRHASQTQNIAFVPTPEPLDLLLLPRIPLPLHDDAVFSQFICPITGEPIRDPVRDPTNVNLNGGTLYERSAITHWLQFKQKSPMTKAHLSVNQLLPAPAVKAVIESRLEHHQQGLLNYFQEHLNDPISAADQAIINQNI